MFKKFIKPFVENMQNLSEIAEEKLICLMADKPLEKKINQAKLKYAELIKKYIK
jgi:hypothetical protein